LINRYFNLEIEDEIIEEVKKVNFTKSESNTNEVFVIIKESNEGDFNKFKQELFSYGYDISIMRKRHKIYKINVVLSNIPDLKKKFFQRVEELIVKYHLEFIESNY
jgi:hypothetical protein